MLSRYKYMCSIKTWCQSTINIKWINNLCVVNVLQCHLQSHKPIIHCITWWCLQCNVFGNTFLKAYSTDFLVAMTGLYYWMNIFSALWKLWNNMQSRLKSNKNIYKHSAPIIATNDKPINNSYGFGLNMYFTFKTSNILCLGPSWQIVFPDSSTSWQYFLPQGGWLYRIHKNIYLWAQL